MLTAAFARIGTILLMTLCAASCGGGSSGAGTSGPPPGVAIGAHSITPTANFAAWVNTNATVATTYYIDGSYTTNGIASIQGSAANGTVSFTTFPQGIAFETAPTAANGFVYLVGGSGGPILFAIDESSGSIVWQQSGQNGTGSTPAVTSQGVYIAAVCTTDGFAPTTGVPLFADNGSCSGGGGFTAVVANNVLYSLAGSIGNGIYVNATTGEQLGTFTADVVPAVNSTTAFFLQSGTLNAKALSDYSTVWSFSGDGGLVTSPIIVGQAIIVGSSSGQIYALDAATGTQLWTANAGGTIYSGNGNVISGLAAGDGLLVVPAGNTLSAFTLSTNP